MTIPKQDQHSEAQKAIPFAPVFLPKPPQGVPVNPSIVIGTPPPVDPITQIDKPVPGPILEPTGVAYRS